MEQTEQIIKLEGDILNLKREYKYAFENLARVKVDTAEVISTKEKVTAEIAQRNKELTEILGEISNEKLNWALKKQEEIEKLEKKNSEADNILKRKDELNKQEEAIRQVEAKNTDILNENRRLELKLQQDATDLESRERQLVQAHKVIEAQKEANAKIMQEFKQNILKAMKAVEKI